MNKNRQILQYAFSDFLTSIISWILFTIIKINYIHHSFAFPLQFYFNDLFYFGLIFVPAFWLLLYYMSGYYRDYKKSRLKELANTLGISVIGTGIIFVLFLKKQTTNDLLLYLIASHFIVTYLPRLMITSTIIYKIRNRIAGFNTLLVGCNENAMKLYLEYEAMPKGSGNKFVGFASINGYQQTGLVEHIKYLGRIDDLIDIIEKYKIEEVIVALETSEQKQIEKVLTKLQRTNITIKVLPSIIDMYTGLVKVPSIHDKAFISIPNKTMPIWQQHIKRFMDISISLFVLIFLSPLFLITAIGVKLSSRGNIIFKQQRIGKNGKTFTMYKFRSMYVDAEKHGPELSSRNDKRITNFGFFMRKTRLDETPQFLNVLIGNMSLVGPRPERQYYIDKIVERAPYYLLLQKVKPGITSWGQVKFGYAENVDEMLERLKFDILYIQDMTIYTDIKILIYTVMIVFKGGGI